ncbi:hypothetical protein SNOG_14024 [Parastagonospora nodorum SN15]|uniref:Uncharacterized protein n=1 Tax=Phaeosphaeria nodorum (strain SN15 / ATCC MYA-4574 / FGSC 10173) TaxID=321614 RepID=Q0U2K9_PHANO|nr:hypothetical protein SNOG_14024 [Parastagonospora nodorum SN15]EAT78649.1 hypothetical protein SNOG_14024 [Parastagonospora nodorum SN15]
MTKGWTRRTSNMHSNRSGLFQDAYPGFGGEMRQQMFVNVGDCVTVVGNEGESTGQLLPLYAPGEQPPVYEVYEGQN